MNANMTGAGNFSEGPARGESVLPEEYGDPFRTAFDACPIPALLLSSEGEILVWNPAFRDLIGHTGKEAPDGTIETFLDRESATALRDASRSGSGTFSGTCRCLDGTVVRADISASPADSGETAVFFALPGGMTFRTPETAGHAHRLETLGLAAAGASHHLNSLLTGILGNITLAALDAPEGILPHLLQAERATSLAAAFTRKVLILARGSENEPHALDTGPIVDEAVGFIRSVVTSGIEISVVKHPPLPPVMADSADLHYILLTLGLNARDAIEDAEKTSAPGRIQNITIDVSADTSATGDHPWIAIAVSDTGAGMTEAVSRRVFEPFFTTKGGERGTGIGLSMTRKLVERHGGRCEVTSSPGNGSTFTVYFPAASEKIARGEESPSKQVPHGEGTILFMDDDQLVRAFAKTILERAGYTVLLAADGAEGLALFRSKREHIQLVIIDLTMPVMSGDEVLREIRTAGDTLPVVITSGFDHGSIRDQIRGLGAAHVLMKPFTIQALTETVRNALEA